MTDKLWDETDYAGYALDQDDLEQVLRGTEYDWDREEKYGPLRKLVCQTEDMILFHFHTRVEVGWKEWEHLDCGLLLVGPGVDFDGNDG